MSNQFLKLRRSSVPGKIPDTASIDFGEIAVNTYDGLAFIKKSGSFGEQVITLGSTSGAFTGSFSGSFTGSLQGTASQAVSSSYAYTASSAILASASLIATSASYAYTASSAISASLSQTASFALRGSGSFTGSFTGSFFGNGSGLTNISASNIVGLNLSQIASGSFTASISPNNGFVVNTSASFTGSLDVSGNITASNALIRGTLTAQTLVVQTISSSIIYSSGSNNFGDDTSDRQTFTGSVNISGSLNLSGSATMNAGLIVSQSINAYNINAGFPTSNQWQTNLNGSYFNNFTTQTDVSEILRFLAGLLSASAPDASPNTRTFGSYTANAQNTTTGTVTAGSVPQSTSNATLIYLQGKGFATTGSTIFAGITPIYTATNYGYTYTSVASGSTVATSSADAQLFGLGPLLSGSPTNFKVSGSFSFKFLNSATKATTATSSSATLITQTGAGTTSGVTLAKINTSNPAVIPAAYQDGKFASVFSPAIYQASLDYTGSGYYHISTSIIIASGSSPYTNPTNSNAEIFYAPLTTISTNVPANTLTGNAASASLSAVSRSLSGAPYLSGSTYNVSASVTGAFNPLYFAGINLAYLTPAGTGIAATSGTTTVSTAGGTVQTANAVFDSTGTTARATSTIPFETDRIKLNGLYTFVASTNTNITQTGISPVTFTVTTTGTNKNASTSTLNTQTIYYHSTGSFGQNPTSGSLAYFGRDQGTDPSTVLVESFLGESYRLQLTNAILTFSGSFWNTGSVYGNLGATDLQVKPGYLVKPGGTYAYWLPNPSAASNYKYYLRKFTTSGTKTSMTLNLGQALVNWEATTNNAVSVAILFESSNASIYTPARVYDPSNLLSNLISGSIAPNTDGKNPFGSAIALYGNTGGSLASTTYTIPIRNADGMILNSQYDEIYVIVKYNGDPTPITGITVTFS